MLKWLILLGLLYLVGTSITRSVSSFFKPQGPPKDGVHSSGEKEEKPPYDPDDVQDATYRDVQRGEEADGEKDS